MAFGENRPRKISEAQRCVVSSGDKMSSLGVFQVELWKKEKNTHQVKMI
jgi:hypothetical protein